MDLPVTTPMLNLHKQLAWAMTAREQQDFYQCRNQVQHLYQGSRAVRSDLINFKIDQTLLKNTWRHHSHLDYFKQDFEPWLQAHRNNTSPVSVQAQHRPLTVFILDIGSAGSVVLWVNTFIT